MKSHSNWLKAACCAGLVTLGFGLVWAFVAKLSYDVVVGPPLWVWSNVNLNHDFDPFVTTQEADPATRIPQYRHQRLNGDVLEEDSPFLKGKEPSPLHLPRSASAPAGPLIPGFKPDSANAISFMRQSVAMRPMRGTEEYELWRLIGVEGRRAYLVGYDYRTKQLIGYIGKNGQQKSPPRAEEYLELADELAQIRHAGVLSMSDQNSYWDRQTSVIYDFAKPLILMIGADGELLTVNFDDRTVKSEQFAAPVRSLNKTRYGEHWAVDNVVVGPDGPVPDDQLFVRTAEQLKLHSEGKWYDFAIPAELKERDFSVIYQDANRAIAMTDRELQEFGHSRFGIPIQYHENEVFWFDAAGHVSRREKVKTQQGRVVPSMAQMAFVMPSSVPHLVHWFIRDEVRSLVRPSAIGWAGLWSLVVGLAGAIACLRREARYETPQAQRWLWAGFLLITGLPGWIGYRFHRAWPLLAACDHCQRLTPQDRRACVACHQAQPLPAARGIEIVA